MKSILLIVLILILATFPISTTADPFTTTLIDDVSDYDILPFSSHIEDKRIYQSQVLTEGHLPIILSPSMISSHSLTGADLTKFITNTQSLKSKQFSFSIDVLVNQSFNRTEYTYHKEPIYENLTIVGYREVIDKTYIVSDYRWVWIPLKSLKSLSISPSSFVVFDIHGKTKATVNKWSVDIVPTVRLQGKDYELHQYAWWNANWDHYTPIYIDAAFVDNPLNNFVLKVNISDAEILANCQPDFDDLRFVTEDNTTEYYFHLEYFSGSRYVIAWVNVTRVSSISDTQINMYYGNAGAANSENADLTYHTDYKSVYHLNETAGLPADSSGYAQTGTAVDGTPDYSQDGRIYHGVYYRASESHRVPCMMTNVEMEAHGFTIDCWVKFDNVQYGDQVMMFCQDDGSYQMYIRTATPILSLYINDAGAGNNWADGTTPILTDTWYHCVAVFDKANTDSHVYLNGRLEGSDLTVPSVDARSNTNHIGNSANLNWAAYGVIDEARTINAVMNLTWVNVTYRNSNESSTLVVWGAEHSQAKPPPSYPPTVTGMTPVNHSIDICPCNYYFCINASQPNGTGMNITIYARQLGNTGWYAQVRYYNVTNNTYCSCMIFPIIKFNMTYQWYVYAYPYGNTSASSNSSIFRFNTTDNPANCTTGGTGTCNCTNTTIIFGTAVGIVGVVGLLGFLNLVRRKEKKKRRY